MSSPSHSKEPGSSAGNDPGEPESDSSPERYQPSLQPDNGSESEAISQEDQPEIPTFDSLRENHLEEAPRRSIAYRISAFVTSLLITLVPALYFFIITALAYGIYLLTVRTAVMWPAAYGTFFQSDWISFALLVLAITALLFLILPLFGVEEVHELVCELDPKENRELFALARAISAACNAPLPTSIQVDWHPRCTARLEGGVLGFSADRFTLIVGIPLVRCVTLQELAGSIAHAVGGFSRHTAPFSVYRMLEVQRWLLQLASERNRFDLSLKRLQRYSGTIGPFLVKPARLCKFGLATSRNFLALLARLVSVVSRPFVRARERDRDRCAAMVVGSHCMSELIPKLGILQELSTQLLSDLHSKMHTEPRPLDIAEKLETRWSEWCKQGSRPREGEIPKPFSQPKPIGPNSPEHVLTIFTRIENVRRDARIGVFSSDLAAKACFTNLRRLSREITNLFYENV